jgi:hypothetical protein
MLNLSDRISTVVSSPPFRTIYNNKMAAAVRKFFTFQFSYMKNWVRRLLSPHKFERPLSFCYRLLKIKKHRWDCVQQQNVHKDSTKTGQHVKSERGKGTSRQKDELTSHTSWEWKETKKLENVHRMQHFYRVCFVIILSFLISCILLTSQRMEINISCTSLVKGGTANFLYVPHKKTEMFSSYLLENKSPPS